MANVPPEQLFEAATIHSDKWFRPRNQQRKNMSKLRPLVESKANENYNYSDVFLCEKKNSIPWEER